MKKKVLIVVSDYYKDISEALLKSTKKYLNKKISLKIIKVPGVFEIPVTISKNIKKFDGFVAIGIIIKGETPNFDLISHAITNGLIELSIIYKKPIGNAILTCLNSDQAKARNNKGEEAVDAVLNVLNYNVSK